jgi:hypothetical protein
MMPSSQILLLWVREQLPHYFEPVLARARELEREPVLRKAS